MAAITIRNLDDTLKARLLGMVHAAGGQVREAANCDHKVIEITRPRVILL